MDQVRTSRRSPGTAPAVCIGVALLLVLLVGGWGAYRDLDALRYSLIQAEITRLRSHAERSVTRIEAELLEAGTSSDVLPMPKSGWLRGHWERTVPTNPVCLYAAVVDAQGKILAHSDPQFVEQKLAGPAIARSWKCFGEGIGETRSPELTGGARAIDISVPINLNHQELATFHAGIDGQWLDQYVAHSRQNAVTGWIVVIGAILAVVFLSSMSLYRITRHNARLETALDDSDARRVNEMSQLIVGMAHEVRNPLNAVRLNLYTAERVFHGDTKLEPEEVQDMLGESVREIERVDELIQQLLGYARVEPPQRENFELSEEVSSTLHFLRHSLDQAHVSAEFEGPEKPVFVRMDRSRLRQILLNLMKNAFEAAGDGGRIAVRVEQVDDHAELSIHDSGPGVPAHLCERVFEPFFTTKDSGTGMGLAVVRSLVEMAGGTIRCETAAEPGGCFRLALPCTSSLAREGA